MFVDPRRLARGVEQQHGEQPGHPVVGGEQHPEESGQLQRAVGEIGPHQHRSGRRGVPGGVHEPHDVEHGLDPCREVVGGGDAVRDAGGRDLLLGTGDPRRHRRFGDEERAGDLGRRQPAQQPQRQRHAGFRRDRRVAAGEDEPQSVVGHVVPLRDVLDDERGQQPVVGLPAAQDVEGLAARDGGQPGTDVGRDPLDRPGSQCLAVRVLDALLGEVEVARDAHRRGEDQAPLATVRVGDGRGDGRRVVTQSNSMISRTSIAPRSTGTRLPTSTAAALSATSKT